MLNARDLTSEYTPQQLAYRDSRRRLRQIADHWVLAHQEQGAHCGVSGMAEVMIHPQRKETELNYVMPRRGTAWVTAAAIQQGLAQLKTAERTPAVRFIEGLFPPQWAETLQGLGLHLKQEQSLLLYMLPSPPKPVRLVRVVEGTEAREQLTQLWQTSASTNDLDLAVYEEAEPVAAARLNVQTAAKTAQWLGMAGSHTPVKKLLTSGVHAAFRRGCDLVYVVDPDPSTREAALALGFEAVSSILTYTEAAQ